jgi:hypothetical protein
MPIKLFKTTLILGLLLASTSAHGETQWMGSVNQWSVGFDPAGDASACRLLWDSEIGKTVEFRAGLKDATWIIGSTQWNIPADVKTVVTVVDTQRQYHVPGQFFDKTHLQLWKPLDDAGAGAIRNLVTQAFGGRPDLTLSFSGGEPDWVVPISRVAPLYPNFVQCMRQLSNGTADKVAADITQPF